jgi:hypothetical protein
MRNLKLKPYTGTAYPTTRQANHNARVLEQELKKVNILSVDDLEEESLLWNRNEVRLTIIHPKKKQKIYVGYDRWGFIIDYYFVYKPFARIDQADLDETINVIKNWYGL